VKKAVITHAGAAAQSPASTEIISPAEGARDDALKAAADKLRAGLTKMKAAKGLFVQGALEALLALTTARKLFPSNKAFGEWCDANGLGEDVLNKDDRAALIAFGSDPERARRVLESSQRTSLRLIRVHEWDRPSSQAAKTAVQISKSAKLAHAEKVNDPNAVAFELIDKCSGANAAWRSLTKIAQIVNRAEDAVREALKRLGGQTQRGENGLEYRLSGSRNELLTRIKATESTEPAEPAKSAPVGEISNETIIVETVAPHDEGCKACAAKDARIAELEQDNANLRTQLERVKENALDESVTAGAPAGTTLQ
jgi:hypothetical protein